MNLFKIKFPEGANYARSRGEMKTIKCVVCLFFSPPVHSYVYALYT